MCGSSRVSMYKCHAACSIDSHRTLSMEAFKSGISHITNKVGITSNEASRGEQQLEARHHSKSESQSKPSHNEPLKNDVKVGESPQKMSTASTSQPPGIVGNAGVKDERRLSTIQRSERDKDKLRQEIDHLKQAGYQWQQCALRYKSQRDAERFEREACQKELSTASSREEALSKENEQLKSLLETRRRELQDAQHFLGTVDSFAESEVVQEVQGLSAEIFNLARSMSDAKTCPDHEQEAQRRAEGALMDVLGSPLLSLLKSTDVNADAVLLEIATQVVATAFFAEIVSTWTNDSGSDKIFTSVYESIRRSENQSVAGQWRALTRKFAQGEQLSGQQIEGYCGERFVDLLRHVATLSGVHSLDNDPRQLRTIQIIVAKAVNLRRLIGEAMISSDYEVVVPRSGTAFMPEEMEDAYKPRGKGRRTGMSVLCCTTMGLRRAEKVKGELQRKTLVKPEVGLQTLLEDLGLKIRQDERMSTSADCRGDGASRIPITEMDTHTSGRRGSN
ncbi:hypothetical protein DAEQUDRAFT_759245 [Daedalea quercina L-15889]|uniref:Uncharacterized protein n=1 Tax=Daedalea quercina L-15889 TaxID=1314783 RepID=A0A165MGC7_9APHY|nr:hypothetical protein DAEQUDRAFT_759245 [Daedalea quercina L-15889]